MKQFYVFLFTLFFCSISHSQTGAALDFDGENDYVTLDSGPTINSSFTVEAWVNPSNTFKTMHIVSTRDGGDFSFDIQLKAGNTIHADIGNGSSWLTTAADATYNYEYGTWFHLAYAVSPTGYVIYVNGNSVATGPFSGTPLLMDGTHKLVLGKNASEQTLYEGRMDEVRVWTRALTKCEINNNLNFSLASGQTGLSIYYKFNQGIASSNNSGEELLQDSSGNNYGSVLQNFGLGGLWGSGTSNWVQPGGVASGSTIPPYVPLVVSSPQNFPSGATPTVANLTATGSAIKWYSAATGGTPLATATVLVAGTYYVTQTTGGCESDRKAVTAAIPTVITSFNPNSGVVGASVTITGTNFNTTAANNIVFFGPTRAIVSAATATSLTVTVPKGQTYAPITVLNTATSLIAYSKSNFNPIYSPAKSTITATDFPTKVDFATGSQNYSVAVGDLDGDGKPDLVTANADNNTISVYQNTAASGGIESGSFASKVDFATGLSPYTVVVGDINGDGKPDLAVTNSSGNTVSVFCNTATVGTITTSSFASKADFATGTLPRSVAIGDLDHDGKPDLAVTNFTDNTISVLRNTGTSGAITISFATRVNFATGNFPCSVVIGDLDGDGKPDLAVANQGSANVSVFRNTATNGAISSSSFANRVNFPTGSFPVSVAVGDLDGDGKPDLAVANTDSNSVSVFRNTAISGTIATGSFDSKVDFATADSPYSAAIGDLDGDGKPDLAVPNHGSDSVSLLRNTATSGTIATGSFATKVDFAAQEGSVSVAIGDLDGDGRPDLAVANLNSTTFSVFRNANNNANLSALAITSGTISPAFATGTTIYTTTLPSATATVTVTPTLEDAAATVKVRVNGGGYVAATSGSPSGALALNIGSNSIEVTVTAQNATTKNYTLTINRLALLDNIGLTNLTPAAAGYSLRKLASAYNGNAVKIRRTSDNALMDIGFDTYGALDTAALLAFTGSSSAYVIKWYDQSGNGNDVAQTNMALQPRIVSAGVIELLNNRPALYFGTANLATSKATLFATATSMVGFAKGNSSTPSAFVTKTGTSSDANNNYPAPFDFTSSGGQFYVGNASTSSGSSTAISNSLPRADVSSTVPASVYSFVIPSSGTFYSYLNGVQSSSGSVVTYADNGNAMQIGNRNDGSSSGNFWTTELVLFNSVLGTTDRQTVETSQKNYYNNRNANLSNLTVSSGSLSPLFAAATTSYTVNAINATSTITVTPTQADTNATITVNGTAVAGGSASSAINLSVGQNTITVAVTAQDGTGKIYIITVTRAPYPPVITSFSPVSGAVGATVTITGTNFNTTPANNIVFFGATRGTVTAATATSLTVTVPTGATYAPITVLNTETALAYYSLRHFNLVYSPIKSTIIPADFTVKTDFAAGNNPYSVAIGDLDGDGKPDLAVANYIANTISVYRNTATSATIGPGSFATKVDFASGSNPCSIAIGDLDGDGKLDLTVANRGSYSVSVLRNTATNGTITTSSFASKVDFATGTDPYSVAIGDVNGDGKIDLAVGNNGSNTVSLLQNTATSGAITTSSFAAKADFATGSGPRSVAISDLDGDGNLDLAVANNSSETVSVLRNTATTGAITASSFAAKVDFAAGSSPRFVTIGDLDGDGKPDLAVVNGAGVSLLHNTTTNGIFTIASFATKVDFATSSGSYSVAIDDMNGDGKSDLVVGNFNANTFSIFRNTATNGAITADSFATKTDFPAETGSISIATGDLDSDGKPDLVTANYSKNTISVFRNKNNNSNLIALTTAAGTISPVFATATTTYTVPATVSNATTTTTVTPTVEDISAAVQVKVNGGSFAAVISGTASSLLALNEGSNTIEIKITAQNGNTKNYTITVTRASSPPVITSFSPISGVVGATVTITGTNFNTTAANNIVFFGATRAIVGTATATSLIVTVPTGATCAPITVLNTATALASYSLSNFNPTYSPAKSTITPTDFAPKVDFASANAPLSVAIGDLDGDGKPDLAVANYSAATISVFRNTATSGSVGSGSFAAKVDFATGANPSSVAIGDLDGDGKPDLAVANYSAATISVFRNTATSSSITTSSFAAKVDFTTGSAPNSVAIGDVNGDGKLDLAVANYSGSSVSVFRNTATSGSVGSGSFAAKVDFATGSGPVSVAIGDLDGDGKPDLAVANISSNIVSIFRNTATSGAIATGSFAAKVDFATGSGPWSLVIGDLDKDGKLDLAVTNYLSSSVSVFRNTATSGAIATGSFAGKVDFATGTNPYSVAIGDLDGDGKPDLAVANSTISAVSLLRNTATIGTIVASSFAARVDLPTGSGSRSVAIGDLDGDGKPDLVSADLDRNSISIFRNTSNNANLSTLSTTAGTISPAFATATTVYNVPITVSSSTITTTVTPTLQDTSAMVEVQVNGGGFTAVTSGAASGALALNEGSNTIEIKITAQNGNTKNYTITVTRASSPPVITSFSPISGVLGATVTITGTNFNTTAAHNIVFFGATRAIVGAATATSLIVTVPTGATYAPITVLNTATALASYSLSNFNPTYSPAKSTITTTDFAPKVDFASAIAPFSLAIGDLDGDGKPDLAVANSGSNSVSVFRSTATIGAIATGSFAAKVDFATGSAPISVAIGDLDGDGKPDLAVTNFGDNTLSVLRNTATSGTITTSSFTAKVDFATGSAPRSVAISDLDGDGKLDLAVANNSSETVSVLRNTATTGAITASSFAAKVNFATGSGPFSVAIGDLDGDGKPDLAVANINSSTVSVFRNTAASGTITTGSFASKIDFLTGSAPRSLVIGDLDGDGKPDLAVANSGSNGVSVFRSTATIGAIATGSFAAKVDFATGMFPVSVTIGDLDGDRKPDLAVANLNSNTVSVFLNTATSGAIATGSFATKVDFTSGTNPNSVAIGDLDGDGKPDLVTAIYSNDLSVIRNANTNANLSTLTTTAGTISPDFAIATTAYTATVPYTTTTTTVTPTVEDITATVQVKVNAGGFTAVTSGTSSGSLALNEGNNTIEVKVTAQNGNTKTYTLTVCRGILPTFTAIAPLCSRSSFVLPTTANNGITGIWSPAINTLATTTYTFTPNASQCADSTTLTVTITPTSDHVTTVSNYGDYTWANNNQVYTTSGIYTGTTTDCVTQKLHLTITPACGSITIWDGNAWSSGVPEDGTLQAHINGDFNSATDGEIKSCSLIIFNGNVVVASGDNFDITGPVIVESGTLSFENNAHLIQHDDVTNTGYITYKRDSNPLQFLDYTIWSSPVSGEQTLKQFSPQTVDDRFYVYNTALNAYSNYTSASGIFGGTPQQVAFTPARGYLIRMPDGLPSGDTTVFHGIFHGTPNNGTISIPLETGGNRYNAVGNPYPSPINIWDFIDGNNGQLDNGTLYFWRKTNNQATTTYATITKLAYNANQSAGGDIGGTFTGSPAEWVINAGQGFFVKASPAATALSFHNSMRSISGSNQFFRTANQLESDTDSTMSRFWLNIASGSQFGQTTVGYTGVTTDGLDYGWDGRLLNDGQVSAYSFSGTTKLAIQARGSFTEADVVIIGYKVATPGTYTISLNQFDGLFGQEEIYLKDKLLGTFHNLKTGAYSFSSSAGTFDDRFEVVYNTGTLGIDPSMAGKDTVVIYQNEEELHVSTTTGSLHQILVYDIRGRLLYQSGTLNTSQTVVNLWLPQQVLIVKVTTSDSRITTKKILIQ